MARPWRDKSGTYHLRQRTPQDLLRRLKGQRLTLSIGDAGHATVGIGPIIQVSLRTKEKSLARTRFSAALASLTNYWEAQRKDPRTLTKKEIVALAGVIYRAFAEALEDNPGEPQRWVNVLAANGLASVGKFSRGARLGIFPTEADRIAYDLDQRFGPLVDVILRREAIVPDVESRRALIEETSRAMTEASAKLARNAGGDYAPDPAAARFPVWETREQAKASASLPLLNLFEKWETHPENEGAARRTKSAYRSVFRAVSEFLDNPSAADISVADLDRYFEARMASGAPSRLTPRVARDVHKAALTSVFGWAVRKRVLSSNPAQHVVIKVRKPPSVRSKAATDAETQALVEASMALPAHETRAEIAALRWCPLLVLYTGARIGEVTQLRKSDVVTASADHPMIRLTPEAGTVKDRETRLVPLHPRLIYLGFLEFVRQSPDGPLFFRPTSRRRKDATTPQSELVAGRVAEFARASGLNDPKLKRPLHALRHRFMTLARRAGVEEQYAEAIAGHSPGKQNREYGDFPADVLHREIRRLDPRVVEGGL